MHMSETNLSSRTATSNESSGCDDGDDDDDQIPAISDRNPEYHESQQCHEYIDQVLNNISVPQPGSVFRRNQPYSSTNSLSTVSTSHLRTQLIKSQVLQIILVTEWFARLLL